MVSHEHISENSVDGYERRSLSPDEILRFQTSVFECEDCRDRATAKSANTNAFPSLFEQFSSQENELEHLQYVQLALFADDQMNAVDREIAESHLAVCDACSVDFTDLQAYRRIAASPPSLATTERETLWQRLGALGTALRLVPLAAVFLLVLGGIAWFLTQRPESNVATANANVSSTLSPIANLTLPGNDAPPANTTVPDEPAPTQAPGEIEYALKDGPVTVDKSGAVKGIESLSSATRQALRQGVETGRIATAANSLGGSGGILMSEGTAQSGVPFALVTPVGRVILEDRPQLRWKPLGGAATYEVAVVDDKFRVIESSGQLTATNWQPTKPLPRGTSYSWQVTAALPDGSKAMSPSSPAPQARFRVVERDIHDDIQTQLRSGNPSHLALGVAYARAGLKQEARREFEKLVKQNPDSQLARRLLQSVQ